MTAAAAKSHQSCLTLCDPIDGSPPESPIPGILQARTLEWVAISFSNAWRWKVKVKSLSRVRLLATPWTAARQAPPSMGFSRQQYWSGCHCDCTHEIKRQLLLGRKAMTNLDSVLKSTDITANKSPCSQSYDFSHSYVGMWELNYKGWVLKNWSFWTLVLEKTLQSTLDSESESHSVVSDSLRPHGLYSPWNSPGQNTGEGSCSLLQGIFPAQDSNQGLPQCRQILYQLSHQESPRILEWVTYRFSSRSPQPRNQTGVSCTAGRFFTSWATRKALTARRSNQSILKEINPEYSLERWCWSWRFNTQATWYEELTHWKRPWFWERLRAGGDRGWDG